MTGESTVRILLVEDDDVDAEGIHRAFSRRRILNPIHRVHNGREALQALRGTDQASAVPRPLLVLLDLNLPQMNGIEFLDEVRNDPQLHDTIILVLTTSDDERDMTAAWSHHVAGYILKSRAGDDFLNLIQLLDHYWRVVEFPLEKRA